MHLEKKGKPHIELKHTELITILGPSGGGGESIHNHPGNVSHLHSAITNKCLPNLMFGIGVARLWLVSGFPLFQHAMHWSVILTCVLPWNGPAFVWICFSPVGMHSLSFGNCLIRREHACPKLVSSLLLSFSPLVHKPCIFIKEWVWDQIGWSRLLRRACYIKGRVAN